MKIQIAIAVLAACGALAASSACSKEKSNYDAGSSPGEVDDETSGAEDAAEEPRDDSPIIGPQRTEVFENLKKHWSDRTDGIAIQADTIRKATADYKDAELDDLLARVDPLVTALRKKLADTKPSGGMSAVSVDLPQMVGEAEELMQKAIARMQVVMQPKSGG